MLYQWRKAYSSGTVVYSLVYLGKMKNVEGKLYIDRNVTLVHQKHPKIPFD